MISAPAPTAYYLPPVPPYWREPHCPEVSVSVVTYNQAGLIGRALDSILEQRVTFTFEIVVDDDGSTDGTRAILEEYQQRHPDKFRLLLYNHRLPGTPGRRNNMLNPMACRGKYTALLDGDDHWIDPDKLQAQYTVMEGDPSLSICLHDTRCTKVDQHGQLTEPPFLRSTSRQPRRTTGVYSHAHFCADRNVRVHTSSFFFRTRIFGDWPPDMEDVVAADHYFFLLISQRGPAYYEDRVRSVNERQPASLSSGPDYLSDARLRRHLLDLDLYRKRFPATRLTPSYSMFAARIAKDLLLKSPRQGDRKHILTLLARLLREPRGVWQILTHKLGKMSSR